MSKQKNMVVLLILIAGIVMISWLLPANLLRTRAGRCMYADNAGNIGSAQTSFDVAV